MKFAATTPHNLEWDQSDHTGVRRTLALAHIDLLLLPFLSTVYVRLVHVNRQRRVQVLRLGITPLTRDIYQIHTGLLFCHQVFERSRTTGTLARISSPIYISVLFLIPRCIVAVSPLALS